MSQPHKSSTPVRPVLDYRALNELIKCNPGTESPVCEDTVRQWRKKGDTDDLEMLDIRKAYLQVFVSPDMYRFQTVLWNNEVYVMTRMGFGLSIAPKMMDIIVKYATRNFQDVDNYVDDLMVPKNQSPAVAQKLSDFGLPTKDPEPASTSRVLGLQLYKAGDGATHWARRNAEELSVPAELTKRKIFSWCGKLVGHYPVCGWLRPFCSSLKRMTCLDGPDWDKPVSEDAALMCHELAEKLQECDPVTGLWRADTSSAVAWRLWCDASDLAYGVALESDGSIIEDGCWLRPPEDKRHINLAELEAVIKGLSLAAKWDVTNVQLMTDSKTVAGWLKQITDNVRRVKTKGLHDVLVQRRLQLIDDLVMTAGMTVQVQWISSSENKADELTRVPLDWVKRFKARYAADVACASRQCVVGPVSLEQIARAQEDCPDIVETIRELQCDLPVTSTAFKMVRDQLILQNDVLMRSVKLPLDGTVVTPVVPDTLRSDVLQSAHVNSGHGNWETMYNILRRRCYFPGMASACHQFVQQCRSCISASTRRGPSAAPTHPDIPGRPWCEVTLDTLELGPDRSGRYHCVLVCVDSFTKWAEVAPLCRHDAASVAEAFVDICLRWGSLEVVRMDNGTEFSNAIVESLFQVFGTTVRTGAVRHPQSQGAAERFNRTLLTLIRKTLANSADWKQELKLLLFTTTRVPMVVPICLQWKQCLAGSLGVLLLILQTPICCLVSGSFAFPSDRPPFAITSRRSFRVVISSPTPERTLTDQMIQCNSCAPTAARSARRRMNLFGKLWM